MKHSILDIRPEVVLWFMKLVLLFLAVILARVTVSNQSKQERLLMDRTDEFLKGIEKSLDKMESGPSVDDLIGGI